MLTEGRSIQSFRFTIAVGPWKSRHKARVRWTSSQPLPHTQLDRA